MLASRTRKGVSESLVESVVVVLLALSCVADDLLSAVLVVVLVDVPNKLLSRLLRELADEPVYWLSSELRLLKLLEELALLVVAAVVLLLHCTPGCSPLRAAFTRAAVKAWCRVRAA